jgi:hypothetical protein
VAPFGLAAQPLRCMDDLVRGDRDSIVRRARVFSGHQHAKEEHRHVE